MVEALGACETPEDYAATSMDLPHPLREPGALDADLSEVVRRLKGRSAHHVACFRHKALRWIKRLQRDLPKPPERGGLPLPNGPLMRALLIHTGYDDPGAADLCSGAPLLGFMGGPQAWPEQVQSEEMLPRSEILARNAAERSAFLASVRSGPHDQSLWDESVKDVAKRRMRGPFRSLQEVASALGTRQFAISRRFGVVQPDKIRPCDDFTRAFVNSGITVDRKLRLSSLDDFFSLAHAMYAASDAQGPASGLLFWRRDHEGAYRQIPIPDEDQPLTVVVFCDPATGEHVFFYHTALPFGATASVYGYNRISRAVTFLARKLLDIPVDSYFDDFWCVDRADLAARSFDAFERLNVLLGFQIKTSKDVHPTSSGALLGIEVDIATLPFTASVTESRRAAILESILCILRVDFLSPGEASTLAGRMNFAASAIFGRVGRAPLRAVYARQELRRENSNVGSSKATYALTRLLRAALKCLASLLHDPPPRFIPTPGEARAPVIVFTDGEGRGFIGGVLLLREDGGSVTAFTSRISARTERRLKPRQNQIALIELLAVLTAVEVFRYEITGRDLLLFVDNTVAEACIRNGYMRRDSRDACELVSALWTRFQQWGINVWVYRVPSSKNIADGPSRPYSPELLAPLYALGLPLAWVPNVQVPAWANEALRLSLDPQASPRCSPAWTGDGPGS